MTTKTSPAQTAASLTATLVGKSARVTKGNVRKGIAKGEVARSIEVFFVEGSGFRVHFKIQGRIFIMWATSSARFAGGQLSLNTGDPTQRATLAIQAAA